MKLGMKRRHQKEVRDLEKHGRKVKNYKLILCDSSFNSKRVSFIPCRICVHILQKKNQFANHFMHNFLRIWKQKFECTLPILIKWYW